MKKQQIKQQIKHLIEGRIHEDGLVESSIKGVKLFRAMPKPTRLTML